MRTLITGLCLAAATECGSAPRERVGHDGALTLPAAQAIGYHTAEGQPVDEPVSLTAEGLIVTAGIHAPISVRLEGCRLRATVTDPSGATTAPSSAGLSNISALTRSATDVSATFRVTLLGFETAAALLVRRTLECDDGLTISVPPAEVFVASSDARRGCGPRPESVPEITWEAELVNHLWLEMPPGRLARVTTNAIIDDCTDEVLLDRAALPSAPTFRGPSRIELDERIFAALAARPREPLRVRVDLAPAPRSALESVLRATRFARIEAGHLEPAIDP